MMAVVMAKAKGQGICDVRARGQGSCDDRGFGGAHTTQLGGSRATVLAQDLVLTMMSHTAASYLPMPLTATICVCPPETSIPINGNWHIIHTGSAHVSLIVTTNIVFATPHTLNFHNNKPNVDTQRMMCCQTNPQLMVS